MINKIRFTIVCQMLVLGICALQISVGNYYSFVNQRLQQAFFNPFAAFNYGQFQNDVYIFVFIPCFTIAVSLLSLYFLKMKRKGNYLLQTHMYLTVFPFCLQAAVAIYSSLSIPSFKEVLNNIQSVPNVPYYTVFVFNQIINLLTAQAILTFVVMCPLLLVLYVWRWQQWAIQAKPSLIVEAAIKGIPLE